MDLEHILLSAVGFHLHAIPMPGIFRETESKLQVTWGRGGENGEFLLNRYSFSWLHNTVNAIHATEPHNLKMVKIATSMLYIFHHNEKNLRKKMCLVLEGGWEEEQGFGKANKGRLLEMFKENLNLK